MSECTSKAPNECVLIAIDVVISVCTCSVPGRARDDIYRIRVSHDVFEAVRVLERRVQPAGRRTRYTVGDPDERIPSPRRRQDQSQPHHVSEKSLLWQLKIIIASSIVFCHNAQSWQCWRFALFKFKNNQLFI